MSIMPAHWGRQDALTRISVTGTGDCYVVRTGSAAPVRVWVCADGVRCECAQRDCSHIRSLELCGFLETTGEQSQAA